MRTKGLAAALLLLLAAACHRGDPPEADNLAHAPTARPVPVAPTPLPPEQALAAAFAAAFPDGGLLGEGDRQTQYVARDLAPLAGGERVAVLADGTGVGLNTCETCDGTLRITYVRRQGTGFAPIDPAITRTIPGDGFGRPPEWRLDTTGPVPVVTLSAGAGAQGCTATRTTIWRLEPDRIVEARATARPRPQGC